MAVPPWGTVRHSGGMTEKWYGYNVNGEFVRTVGSKGQGDRELEKYMRGHGDIAATSPAPSCDNCDESSIGPGVNRCERHANGYQRARYGL